MLDKVKPDEALPRRISAAQNLLKRRVTELESISGKLGKHHDLIFKKILNAQRHNMHSYAHAYAQELAQVRKTRKMIENAALSLEQVRIRLDTVSEVGDMIVTLSPCMSVIRNLGPSIGGIMPHANESMQDFSQMLGDMMSGSSMSGVNVLSSSNSDVMNSDAKAILEEAQNTMIGAVHSAIPDIPTDIIQPQREDAKIGQASADLTSPKVSTVNSNTPRIQTTIKREIKGTELI